MSRNTFDEMELNEEMSLVKPAAGAEERALTTPMEKALEAREMADIQGKIYMAKQFPRKMAEVTQAVDAECSRLAMASKATYVYARGGQNISGPSIRLVETIARCMGNIKSETETLSQTAEASLVRTSAYDYEGNRQAARTFVVRHERDKTSWENGRKVKVREQLTDNRDIMEQINTIAARNRRACLLELIPADLVERAVAMCEKTMASKVKISPELIQNLISAFSDYGVSRAQIEARIQRSMDAITVQNVLDLRQVYTSLKDGMGKPEDFFDMNVETQSDGGEALKSPEKPKRATRPKAKGGATATEVPSAAPATEPVHHQEETPAPKMDSVPEPATEGPAPNEYADSYDDGLQGPEAYGDDDTDIDF